MTAQALLDSSVAIALLLKDHNAHATCREAVGGMQLGLAGHALFETMSVMSRLPGSSRRSIDAVHRAVTGSFPHTQFLSARASARIAASVASLGIGGGAIYDALVAAAALEHGLPLATRDVRALATYRAIGCELMIVN